MKRLSVALLMSLVGGCANVSVPQLPLMAPAHDPSLSLFDGRYTGPAAGLAEVSPETTSSLFLQHRALGVAPNSVIDGYVNEILAKLQKTLPGTPLASRVYVTPSVEFNAASFKDGGIYIPYRVLEALESEDELAALIAHEYAHVLLQHHQTNWMNSASSLLYSAGKIYIGQRGQKNVSDNELLRMLAINDLSLGASQIGLIPALTRDQEAVADRLGTDLMIRAGYSYVGAHKLLGRLRTWDEQNTARQEALRKDYFQLFSSSDKSMLAGLIDGQVDKLEDQATKLVRQWGRHHDSGDTRIEGLREYIRQHYADADRPMLRVAAYEKVIRSAQARQFFSGLDQAHASSQALMQQDRKAALASARQAERSAAASSPFARHVLINALTVNGQKKDALGRLETQVTAERALYSDNLLLINVLRNAEPQKALEIAQRSYDNYGEPAELLPDLIALNKQLNRSILVMKFYGICAGRALAATDNALLESCNKAKG